MKEDFLHYLWKYKKFQWRQLHSTQQEELIIHTVGVHNTTQSGPDFFNAQLTIAGQRWAGNVELHVHSSDWYVHRHENDTAYDNVILHVVWEEDVAVFRKDNTLLPTLALQSYVPLPLLEQYQHLFANTKTTWLYCENGISSVPDFIFEHWKERIYVERLARKSKHIEEVLIATSYDWEAVLFRLLAKNFGVKVNQDAFFSMACSIDFKVVRKCRSQVEQLEALFLGQAGLLTGKEETPYAQVLWKEYQFLKAKFKLTTTGVLPSQFFRLRPSNFPTIRLVQLAQVYAAHSQLFAQLMTVRQEATYHDIFAVATTEFWKTHYTFDKESPSRIKKMTPAFVHLLVMNTIIPLQFMYRKTKGLEATSAVFECLRQIPKEQNAIIKHFEKNGIAVSSALDTQALLELKTHYCDRKRCLDCAVGNHMLG